jgi:N-acetylneuraminate synthase
MSSTRTGCYIVAEIGINHNGDVELAKRLIDIAAEAGCDAVKFQKRTVDVVYSPEELLAPRNSPFGTTNGDLKRALEFGYAAYSTLFRHAQTLGIDAFASVWDVDSVTFMEQFDGAFLKIPSPLLTHGLLLERCRRSATPIVLSTGMSTPDEIRHAIKILEDADLTLLACTSCYPCPPEEINLRAIETLRRTFGLPIGYSGHELGLGPSVAAVALGAVMVERHITVARDMWGSDQKFSLEPGELRHMVKAIRDVESALGDGRIDLRESEVPALRKLRRAAC